MISPLMSRWWMTGLLVLLVVLTAGHLNAQEPCTPYAWEGWDGGTTNGWVGSAGTALTVPTAGGNPGGYLHAQNSGIVGAQAESAPWAGNWAAAGVARIVVDLYYPSGDLQQVVVRIRRDGMTNGWYFTVDQTGLNDDQWHHYEVPVNPNWSDVEAEAAGWWDTAGVYVSFADTVADVGIFQVSGSASTVLVLGVDNMTLSPCLFSDGFESGEADRWSSATP